MNKLRLLLALMLSLFVTTLAAAQGIEHEGHDHGGGGDNDDSTAVSCPLGGCTGETGVCDVRPNPCHERAMIHIMAPANSHVKVAIYNSNMAKICTLTDGVVEGDFNAAWNGTDESGQQVAAGVYFCEMDCQMPGEGHNHPTRSLTFKKILLTR